MVAVNADAAYFMTNISMCECPVDSPSMQWQCVFSSQVHEMTGSTDT